MQESNAGEGVQTGGQGVQRTTLTRSWVVKTSIFLVVLGALGVWGLVDATIVYPSRGRAHASFMEFLYLGMANEAGMLSLSSVSDPTAALRELNEQRKDLEDRLQAAGEGTITFKRVQMDLYKREWLISLSRVGMLTPEHTMIASPAQRAQELINEWANKNPPKPLAAYDIPMQWVFVVIGFGGAAWFASLLLRMKKRVFTYDPAERRLTLPDGRSITPDQITELDKRKWDKFFVTLRLQDGASVKLDLLRHTPLEQWVLEMEKHTPGYEAENEASKALDETVLDVSRGRGSNPEVDAKGVGDPN